MKTVWINVTTFDGELIERIAIVEGEKTSQLLTDIDEAVERTRRIQDAPEH
jgi:hypothetical protein